MVLADVLLGYFVSKLLDKKSSTATPPFVVTPTTPGTTTPTTPTTPASGPPYPTGLIVPASNTQPAAGMKRAVEVWVVNPAVANAATIVVGDDVVGAAQTLAQLEAAFPSGWQSAKVVTAAEIQTAKSLLPKWKQGGVIFMGPQTMTGRRAYRMTMHPSGQAQPSATPVAAPTTPAPSGIVPASYKPPVATPAPTAVPTGSPQKPPPTPAAQPTPPVAPAAGGQQVTRVRRGEGLAQISKRLGMGESQAGAVTIQKANVPNGPDATWKAIALTKGGLQKAGRAGGLQPGDRLWVPRTWGPYDASKL